MAQDLGMHRSADGWTGPGGKLFSECELQERKRIWWTCLIMDRYVSTYMGEWHRDFGSGWGRKSDDGPGGAGRPLAIFDADFDTQLPDDNAVRSVVCVDFVDTEDLFCSRKKWNRGNHTRPSLSLDPK